MTLWDKGAAVDEAILAFSAGDEYLLDQRLVPYDCRASIAHARMLASIGVLDDAERDGLIDGLKEITRLHAAGDFPIAAEQEDCHTAIEEWLTEHVGEAGKKIHVGRSRNDQVLTAMRLLERDALGGLRELMEDYQRALTNQSVTHARTAMPGYTHMRRAMPTTAGTWLAAFAQAVNDDLVLCHAVESILNQSPLGTGAGYGIPVFPVDREMTAKELGFARVQENPIYAQMTRGAHEGMLLSLLTQIMFGLNRLASDLILFSTTEFGFVRLPTRFCTGSSIMPQKHNPDVLELVRARYHVTAAEEFKVKGLIGNLMSGYQRDLGLTKEPTIKALDTTAASLRIMALVVEALEMDEARCKAAMSAELYATEEAYGLVRDGMAFRDAYKKVGEKFKE